MTKQFTILEKILSTLVTLAACFGLLWGGINYFMPKDAAQQEHQAIVDSLTESHKQDRIERHDREIARLERDLRNPESSGEERDFIVREIQRLEKRKECIRESTC